MTRSTSPHARARSIGIGFLSLAFILATIFAARGGDAGAVAVPQDRTLFPLGVETLDGSSNNARHAEWGQSFTQYPARCDRELRRQHARDAGRPSRALHQQPHLQRRRAERLLRERRVPVGVRLGPVPRPHLRPARRDAGRRSQHPVRRQRPARGVPQRLSASIAFNRTPGAPGTGVTTPRQQINTVSSYIDAWAVYGGTDARLEWLRDGPVDGDLSNNSAMMLTSPDGYLPHTGARGDAATAPAMDVRAGCRARRRTPSSPATCEPTRTSRSPRCRRCSCASTTASSTRCLPNLPPSRRSSRSRAASSARRSSTSRTTSSCPRWASSCSRTAATTRRVDTDAQQRVRHRRLPGAQHDPRRVRGRGRRR